MVKLGGLVCLVLALVTVGCAHKPIPQAASGPAPEARDEYRGALYAAEFGVHTLDQACAEEALDLDKSARTPEAFRLAHDCAQTIDALRDDMVKSVDSLEAWSIAPQHTACLISERMRRVVPQYNHLRNIVGGADDTADDGYARAEWLASRCP